MIDYEPIISCVYQIDNKLTGRKYIGQTNNIERRWNNHASKLTARTHRNINLQNDWHRYGINNFTLSVIEKIDDVSKLRKREKHHMEIIGATSPLYNLEGTSNMKDYGCMGRDKHEDDLKNVEFVYAGLKSAYYPEILEILKPVVIGDKITVIGLSFYRLFKEAAEELNINFGTFKHGNNICFNLTIKEPKTAWIQGDQPRYYG